MYPNLLGQKEYYHLTDRKMAEIIGVSRKTYCRKLQTGSFFPDECQTYCLYFNKPFHYLFATQAEIQFCFKESSQTLYSSGASLMPAVTAFNHT